MFSESAQPDYLVIGHVTRDLLPGDAGYVSGGTATYAALTAQRLGLQAAVVTACAPEDRGLLDSLAQAGVWIHAAESPETTTFRNVYSPDGHRTQILGAQGRLLSYGNVPEGWRSAAIVHLGPVAQELPSDMPGQFPDALLGITPQGWMRSWDSDGRVAHSAVPPPLALRMLPENAIVVLSVEDLDYNEQWISEYTRLCRQLVVTQGYAEARLYFGGQNATVPACSAQMADPTGAGDVFAAAFFARYKETADLQESARFAHAAAAFAIEAEGTIGIADRQAIENRMRKWA